MSEIARLVSRPTVALGLVALAMVCVPIVFGRSDFVMTLAITTLLFAFLGQAWNILGGYAGQYSFGHAAFFGAGAYGTAIAQVKFGLDAFTAASLGVAAGTALAAFIGAVSFRAQLRGSYFALVTLAFAEVARVLATSFALTGAGAGLLIPLAPGFDNLQFSKQGFYFLIAILTLLSLALVMALERSRFGAFLLAIRENEDSARALGVDAAKVKTQAIMLSGALSALGGVFYAQVYLYIDPTIGFGTWVSVEMLLGAMIGGLGTVFGPLIGSIVLHLLGEGARGLTQGAPGLNLVIYGVMLILIVRFAPDGILGLVARLRAKAARTPERPHA
jgi:branched-chain amino acid transport system permease protein